MEEHLENSLEAIDISQFRLRSEAIRPAFEFKKKHDQLQEEAAVSSFDINSVLSAKEMEKNIAKVIAAMPERRREIFEMSRTQKLSNAEIADRLGISIRTVEKHIENALSDIRHKLPVSILGNIIVAEHALCKRKKQRIIMLKQLSESIFVPFLEFLDKIFLVLLCHLRKSIARKYRINLTTKPSSLQNM